MSVTYKLFLFVIPVSHKHIHRYDKMSEETVDVLFKIGKVYMTVVNKGLDNVGDNGK